MRKQEMDLFEKHQDLAERAARSVWARTPGLNGLDEDDYRQLALLGLLAAAKKYRPRLHGQNFEAWAWKPVVGAVKDGIRQADEVGRYQREHGQAGPTVSLDQPAGGNDGERLTLLRDLLPAAEGEQRLEQFEAVGKLLAGLPRESRAVLYLTEVDGLPLFAAACVLGVTESYLSLIRSASLDYLARCHALPGVPPARGRLADQPSLFEEVNGKQETGNRQESEAGSASS